MGRATVLDHRCHCTYRRVVRHFVGIKTDTMSQDGIEVFEMSFARRVNNSEWPEWLNRAWQMDHDRIGSVYPSDFPDSDGTDKLCVMTENGPTIVNWGDVILKHPETDELLCMSKSELFQRLQISLP